MVPIIDYNDGGLYYQPPRMDGLKEIILLPDGEFKRQDIPNSSIWVFDQLGHEYVSEIFAGDIGCGMSVFILREVEDIKSATDKIYDYLNGQGILGRGNHFVDLCSGISNNDEANNYNLLILHTDGKRSERSIPSNLEEAINKQNAASKFREELGFVLAEKIGAPTQMLADYPHNFIEQTEEDVIYRKGAVKVHPEKTSMLPASLTSTILFYTVPEKNNFPYSSMPHATGRSGPRGQTKVSVEEASQIRRLVYIPEGISNSSLRTEHPYCFNSPKNIFEKLGDDIIPIGSSDILGYVGKI